MEALMKLQENLMQKLDCQQLRHPKKPLNMDDILLTKHQAYQAMFSFIENLYEMTKDSELGGYLGSMQILEDGKPADPAYSVDWERAIAKVVSSTK